MVVEVKEIFLTFRSKRSWIRMIVSAVVFFVVALPFKSLFTLLPGVTEIRPANMIPPVLGLYFGPAAAWGISLGNLVSDITAGSGAFVCISGFVANFFYSYIPYKLWYTLKIGKQPIRPIQLSSVTEIVKYILIILIDSLVTTTALSLIFESAGFQAMASSFPLLFFNNFDFAILLGIPVLSLLEKYRVQPEVPKDCYSANQNPKGKWLDISLYLISAVGVVYLIFSGVTHMQIRPSVAFALLCFVFVGLFLYPLRPVMEVEEQKTSKGRVKISIKTKVTIGFLLLSVVFLLLIGIVTLNTININGQWNRLETWNYLYLVVGITINIVYAVAIAFLWYVEKNITLPIERLSNLTEVYAKQEHDHQTGHEELIQHCSEIPKGDEIGALAQSFQKMMEELDSYMVNLATITADKERIATELNVAKQIQASMMPCIFPAFPERSEFDIYATMMPAKEVGGDFYDFFLIDEKHLAVVMADVSGKGVPAALFMVIGKTLIKNQAQLGHSPAEIFTTVNMQLCENNDAGLFVTSWMGILDIETGKFTYVNAGHNPPLLKKSGGEYEYLRSRPGFVLAGMEGIRYRQFEMTLEEGDMLYLYTDGVTEATNSENQLYGEDRLVKFINQHKDDGPQSLLTSIKGDIDSFVGEAPQFDDITMLCLKIKSKNNT